MDPVTTIVHLRRDQPVHRAPAASARTIGMLAARTRYLHASMHVPLISVSADGAWGRVRLPWRHDAAMGWIRLRGLRVTHTPFAVIVHRDERRIDVLRAGRRIATIAAGIGAAGSPTPAGSFFVTERVAVPADQRASFGSFAFGLSGLQASLPAGWTGGDQLAIHGTGDAASIGRAASAGCVRVSEPALRRLRRWLVPGTPVEIR
jgi:hypothetical protein